MRFKAYGVKEDPTNKGIVDRILLEIRRSRFCGCRFRSAAPEPLLRGRIRAWCGPRAIGCCREDDVKGISFGKALMTSARNLRIAEAQIHGEPEADALHERPEAAASGHFDRRRRSSKVRRGRPPGDE
jgi:hypothetical protein